MIRQSPKLTARGTRAILEAAEGRARTLGVAQCIAVVDEGGHLLAFSRMDGGKISSVRVAITKAVSAATRRSPTGPMPSVEDPSVLLSLGLPLATQGAVTPIRGGLPIVVDGQVVGGIGVSSGTEEQDVDCASAGVAALKV
jgi:glc operon protein GlcG